jgi:hypothetical protein
LCTNYSRCRARLVLHRGRPIPALLCTGPGCSGSIASVATCCRCASFTFNSGHWPLRSTSSVCPPLAVKGKPQGTETGYRWRYAWGYCIPKRIRTLTPSILMHLQWLIPPLQEPFRSPTSYTFRCPSGQAADAICSLFHLCTRLPRERTYVRTN